MICKNIISKFLLSSGENINAPSHIDDRTSTLALLGVLDNSESSIIAECLLSKVEQFCLMNKKDVLRVGVASENIKSRFFYRKRGYIIDEILGENSGTIFMYKRL